MKNRIKILRTMNDLTQEQLAEKVGLTRQTILAIENDKYDPSLTLAYKISKEFNVKIDDVFTYED